MLKLRIIIFLLALIACSQVLSKTYVKIKNNTNYRINLDVKTFGNKLPIKSYKQILKNISPKSESHYLWFNRDKNIKKNKYFYFLTSINFTNQNLKKNSIKLWQVLRGKFINSKMWQSLTINSDEGITWNSDREIRYKSVVLDNKLIKITYYAVKAGINDNVIYQFDELNLDDIFSGQDKTDLKILSYNLFMRPSLFFKDGQKKRYPLIANQLKEFDIIGFSELFDDKIRRKFTKKIKPDYPFQTTELGSDRCLEQDGGVQIVSKWPILEEDERLFKNVCSRKFEDCFADKGIKYAKILFFNKIIHVFATHLQNGKNRDDLEARGNQVKIFSNFIESKNISKDDYVFYIGDFNISYYEKDKIEFNSLLTTLSAKLPQTISEPVYSLSPFNDFSDNSGSPDLVDFVLYSSKHRKVNHAIYYSYEFLSKHNWNSRKRPMYDLSDHYGIVGEFYLE